MRAKRITLRHQLVQQFGGACQQCGYARCLRALQFHHVDTSEKSQWSPNGRVSNAEIAAHPERFRLLCANCHFERHDAMDAERAVYIACRVCGKMFQVKPKQVDDGRKQYCSKACQYASMVRQPGETTERRFWKHVQYVDECWLWDAYVVAGTTPVMTVKRSDGRLAPRSVRQLAWEFTYGESPGCYLSMACGNHHCVNPSHMRRSTRSGKNGV